MTDPANHRICEHLNASSQALSASNAGLVSEEDLEKTSGPEKGHASRRPSSHVALPTPEESSPPSSPDDEFTYPEGGLRAWLVVFGAWCGIFGSLGIANSLAAFQAYISENQLASYQTSQVGWIFSVWTFLLFACGIYVGPIFDVYGPRWLVLSGSICVVLM